VEPFGGGLRAACFRFGKTTLEDIRSDLKSEGILFRKSPPVYPTPDGGVMIASTYELANTTPIASLISKISVTALAKLKLKYGAQPIRTRHYSQTLKELLFQTLTISKPYMGFDHVVIYPTKK
jgi:hypothetical protein